MIRDCAEVDLPGVLEIYNEAVLTSTAVWNDTIVDIENRRAWLRERVSKGFPVLVAVEGDDVLGYASYGDWRAWNGYRHTVEHSVYVAHAARRRGIATSLMSSLMQRAQAQGKHVMVGAIEASNEPSLALHDALGFRRVGCMPEVGFKFGRWLDLVFVQMTFG